MMLMTKSRWFWVTFFTLILSVTSAVADDEFLQPEQAFKFSAEMVDAKTIAVRYVIADGYYMYRERFQFSADGAAVGFPLFPQGHVKFDETFQKNVETYNGTVSIKLPVESMGNFTLHASAQGCAEKGLCYSPISSQVSLSSLNNSNASHAPPKEIRHATEAVNISNTASIYSRLNDALTLNANGIGDILKGKKLLLILPLFLLFGLALSLTPCVLPMVPILSFIIVGEGASISRRMAFALSLTYSSGMAIVYTGLGVASGLLGEGLSGYLQNPWVLGSFSILIMFLALSMFDVYHLHMPAAIEQKMLRISKNQKAGKFTGVFVMGLLSALILSPCVTAPLTGVLLYIGQTRDALFGGLALLTIAVGMSVPLLLVGISAGALLPRAGKWMNGVKQFFGVLMLGMALWVISPLISNFVNLLAWIVLLLGYAVFLLYPGKSGKVSRGCGAALLLLAGILIFHGADQARQQTVMREGDPASTKLRFKRIKTLSQLDTILSQPNRNPILLDFYADWCVACKEMEKRTFSDVRVQKSLANFVLLQVDVTANNLDDRQILQRFNLFGPPGIIFFDRGGSEIDAARVVGYQNVEKFIESLSYAQQQSQK